MSDNYENPAAIMRLLTTQQEKSNENNTGKNTNNGKDEQEPRQQKTWNRERILRLVDRILWWLGLMLLLPAPISFFTEQILDLLIAIAPPDCSWNSIPALCRNAIEMQRFLIVLCCGYLCWIMSFILHCIRGWSHDRDSKWWPYNRIFSIATMIVIQFFTVISGGIAFIVATWNW